MARVRQRFDVLVVGGGPAGMAAAVRAAESGLSVGIVDDNASLGGQIWRGPTQGVHSVECQLWSEKLQRSGVTLLCGYRVVDHPEAGLLVAEGMEDDRQLLYRTLILATGARERFLPFPGWTLPNVMGAGGLQAMVKSGLPIGGKRVVVAGTGPLLLAVAAYLRKQGAAVVQVCEQASWGSLANFGAALVRFPQKTVEALSFTKKLLGIPFATNSWPLEAHGGGRVESVTISHAEKQREIRCDFLACGFHLLPNVELPVLLGCKLAGPYVQVDDFQRTSVGGVYCAGEPTGIGGIDMALIEGQVAGLAAAGRTVKARELFKARNRAQRFAHLLDRTFALRAELRSLPQSDTFVCRCEDVSYSRLRRCDSWRAAKLHTRCGMGPCQGRICGPATEFLFSWQPDSVRPPIFPSRIESLEAIGEASP